MTGLELKIVEFIEKQYKAEFLGSVKIEIIGGDYNMKLFTSNPMNPIVICSQATDDDSFYNFVTKEISERNLVRVDHVKLIKIDENKEK